MPSLTVRDVMVDENRADRKRLVKVWEKFQFVDFENIFLKYKNVSAKPKSTNPCSLNGSKPNKTQVYGFVFASR